MMLLLDEGANFFEISKTRFATRAISHIAECKLRLFFLYVKSALM
jgi:hypothetical protein